MENDNNVNGNLNDNSVLDALVLTREQWRSGIVKAVIFTLIAVIIFFVPVTVRGSTDVTFGIIYKNIKAGLGLAGLWMASINPLKAHFRLFPLALSARKAMATGRAYI